MYPTWNIRSTDKSSGTFVSIGSLRESLLVNHPHLMSPLSKDETRNGCLSKDKVFGGYPRLSYHQLYSARCLHPTEYVLPLTLTLKIQLRVLSINDR